MDKQELKNLILLGENVNTELKLAEASLPKNIFETVCAFLNTIGGTIILGVNDEKEIVGIEKDKIEKLKKDFSTMCNNEQILKPTIISELKEAKINGKVILYAHIDEANCIHKYKGKVFVKIMAGILALLMVAGTGITLVYALMA